MALACALVVATEGPASAQWRTMRSGLENISMAPMDVIVAPAVAVRTLQSNLDQADMSGAPRHLTLGLGTPWIMTLQYVVAGARIVSGFAEIGLGLVMLPATPFTEIRSRTLFDATTANPLVNRQGAFNVVFGAHYFAAH